MKIIIFSHAAGSPTLGPNMRWYYLGKRLVEMGCEVTIVGSSQFHKYFKSKPQKRWFNHKNIDGINYIYLKNKKYTGFFGRLFNQALFPVMVFLWTIAQGKRKDYDIVVASSPPPFCAFPAYYLSQKVRAHLVYETRDLWPLVVKELKGASHRNPYIALLGRTESFAIKNADLVVSVKQGDYYYFRDKYGLPAQRFSWEPNGFLPDNTSLSFNLNETKNDDETITVGYVGAMSAYYGLRNLLDAAYLLKDEKEIKFLLVGDGEDYKSLLEVKSKLDLNNVEFRGAVPKAEVPRCISEMDICYVGLKDVAANLHGISCNKIFEYMHASKPIIASYKTWFDPVQEAKCGLTVAPDASRELAAAIEELKKAPEKREQMGQKGRAYFEKNHDFSVIAEHYLKSLRELDNIDQQ